MSKYTWEEAMDWWKSNDNGNYKDGMNFHSMIREAACKILLSDWEEGQGLGSSDINHGVYNLYGDYLSYVKYCKENGEEVNMISFLMDATADV